MKFLPLNAIDLEIAIDANKTLEMQIISMAGHLAHSGNSQHIAPMMNGAKEIRGYKSKISRLEDIFFEFEISSKLTQDAKDSLRTIRTAYNIDPRVALDEHSDEIQDAFYKAIEEALFSRPPQPKKNQLEKIQGWLDKGINGELTDHERTVAMALKKAVDDAQLAGLWLDPSKGILKEMPITADDAQDDAQDDKDADAQAAADAQADDKDADAQVVQEWVNEIQATVRQKSIMNTFKSMDLFYDALVNGKVELPTRQVNALVKKIEATLA